MTAFAIIGARPGSEFRLTEPAHRQSSATFVAVWDGTIHVTRRLSICLICLMKFRLLPTGMANIGLMDLL
jgi:hypothetical protein